MPDISMCGDWKCPSAHACVRSEVSGTEPSDHQTFAFFDREEGSASCSHFIAVIVNSPTE
jgi:hypothetical protein